MISNGKPSVPSVSASHLGQMLSRHHFTVSTAESCTGGMIAAAITDIAGSSGWFERGYITYSNAAKIQDLSVSAEMINQYGAVSEPVARAMAQGALAASGAHFALSVTGVAGPGGGTPGKPVGTVCFGWAAIGMKTLTHTHHFDGDRAAIREQTVQAAFDGLAPIIDRLVEVQSQSANARPDAPDQDLA